MESSKRAAVIGAGAAGIVSAKILLEGGWIPDVFEKYNILGGTWIYDEIGTNKHSSMYKNLRTNLPKELMLLNGLDYDIGCRSYLSHFEVLNYLNQYVDKFNLKRVIKFETEVTHIKSLPNEKWSVTTVHIPEQIITTQEYDSVFVCNGHNFLPNTPLFDKAESFKGFVMHSHNYRTPARFSGQNVLIIGSGPSGRDITLDLAPYATKVVFSHRESDLSYLELPKSVELKPEVLRFQENSVVFKDHSSCSIDSVIYCTGYKFSFPFLNENCDIQVDDNYVHPLYNQLVSISHPTMFFIGLPSRTFIFPMLELQARTCIRIINHEVDLPPKETMEKSRLEEIDNLKRRGYPKRKYHLIADRMKDYLNSVACVGGLNPLPEVLFKIYDKTHEQRRQGFLNYREYDFSIVDDQTYEMFQNGQCLKDKYQE